MTDQAKILRGLMENRPTNVRETRSVPHGRIARTIAVTSGKGGVGKSNVALNLAVALSKLGSSVCLLDANFGLGNIDLLCGLNGYWNLSHVVTGARLLRDIVLEGPAGIHVIPGASGIGEIGECPDAARDDILSQLGELEREHDFLLIDTGAGIQRCARRFVTGADVVLVLTTPEPTSIADAYATIKSLSTEQVAELDLLVTQTDSAQYARAIAARVRQTAKVFLHTTVHSAGFIPRDPAVVEAVVRRSPFVLESPQSPASRAIVQLARNLRDLTDAQSPRGNFFGRLWNTVAARVV